MKLSEEMREYLFRLSESQPVTMPEAGWPDEVAQLETDLSDSSAEIVQCHIEIEALRQQVDGLEAHMEWVQHKPWCTFCDCGLLEAGCDDE